MEPMISHQSFVLHAWAFAAVMLALCAAIYFCHEIDRLFTWINSLWKDEKLFSEDFSDASMHVGGKLCLCIGCMQIRREEKLAKAKKLLGKQWLLAVPKCQWCHQSPSGVCSFHRETREKLEIPKAMRDKK